MGQTDISADGPDRDHVANLDKVDHIVVLMLENRSFDHMLGYLSLTGGRPEIDGLRTELANQYQGRSYPVHHLASTALEMDPDHSASAIDQQVADGNMGGFVASAAATLAKRGADGGDPGCVMGYYDAADVPVYDHLAEEFAVCDRWFSSVPGATLPNRLYALCGLAAGSRDDNDAVRREVPADRLLEWSPADGWEPICERLCLPAPDDPFPVTNTANETRAMFGFPPLDTAG